MTQPAEQTAGTDFSNSRVCEMACQWLKPDSADAMAAYFQEVFPVAQSHGARPLGRLMPEEAVVGNFLPHVIGMVEWPMLESFDAFMEDVDYRRLSPQRDAALDRLVVTHLRAVHSASVALDPHKVYELAGLWIRPDGGRERLIEYFAKSLPIAREYGGKPVLQFEGVRSAWGDFLPTQVRVTEWLDVESWKKFSQDKRVANLQELRDSALSKLTVTRCSAQPAGH